MVRGYTKSKLTELAAFDMLVSCAREGERCPKAGVDGLESVLTSALARAGKIRVDVYPHNYRVITILEGPHAGKSTAPAPNPKWKPYLTLGPAPAETT